MKQRKIGSKIKELRKERKLTQTDLANSLGYYDKSVISHIEKGDADMTYEKILLLIRTYMLDANRLFDVEEIDKKIGDFRFNERKNKKVCVYIHGLNGSKDEAEDFSYLKVQYDVVGLDYKDGNPWEIAGILREEFKKITYSYKEIIVIANSIGAFYAYQYLSDFNIKKAFFISPIASMLQQIINLMLKYNITRDKFEEEKIIKLENGQTLSYDFYKEVSNESDNWNVPTEILYGSRDDVVYIENIADFLAHHPHARLTIKQESEHYFHTPKEKEFIKEWILRNLPLTK